MIDAVNSFVNSVVRSLRGPAPCCDAKCCRKTKAAKTSKKRRK